MHKENNKRRYPGESNKCRPDRAADRREKAIKRQEDYNSLSPQKRLENLDAKFGIGKGAKRERAKLLAKINMNKSSNVVIEDLDKKQLLPDDIMQEIDAINEEMSSKKKLKAKERRARAQKE